MRCRAKVESRCGKMSMLETREFIINQKLLATSNTYIIKNRQQEQLGFAKREILSLGPRYSFEGNSGERLGEIQGKVVSLNNEFEIKDGAGRLVARVKKKLLKVLGSEWQMEDPQGNEVARVDGNILHHEYNMVAPDRSVIAQIHLKWATIKDEYSVGIVKPDFSPLLVLGFTIAMEHVEHYEEKKKAIK
jgi:uncharacterized protein YxjI